MDVYYERRDRLYICDSSFNDTSKFRIVSNECQYSFPHGGLAEDIYMDQPEGFILKSQENKVCHLKRFIYGLKQAVVF